MKIGFDLDGVLRYVDMASLRALHGLTKQPLDRYRWAYGCIRPLLHPQDFSAEGDEIVILSAQPTYAIDLTERWLDQWLPGVKRETLPFDPITKDQWDKQAREGTGKVTVSWADWKAERIRANGIEVFIDDGPDIVRRLRSLLGDKTKVIQYGGRLV